jgi:hypothetical protein
MFSREQMQRAIEDALKQMEGVALELYRRGREEAREELEQVTRERDEARAELATLRKDYDSVLEANVGLLDGAPWADVRRAYRRGAEAMREACARWMSEREGISQWVYDDALSALPIPEDK